MGFDAIWISPIPKNYPNDYYGYGAMNIYELNIILVLNKNLLTYSKL